ncbi:MAG: helix-turn-helix transcriptional regulator [Muribaculaceae bacterium]|nr:helix-turn-helix transcriptional regulator [Muribaculaceae bacterium]
MSRNENEILKNFAKRVRIERKKLGYSQEELSLICEIERSTVYRIEKLKRFPSLRYAIKIAHGLNLDIIDLLK